MDSFNLMEEINRNYKCADELYRISDKILGSHKDKDVYHAWFTKAKKIIDRYNVTMLLPILFEKTSRITNKSSISQIRTAVNDFYKEARQAIEKRKFDLGRLHIDEQNRPREYRTQLGKVKITIEFYACENGDNKIMFDNLPVVYDDLDMNTNNTQWNSLLTGFIYKNGEFCLTDTQIEDSGHTARGRATNECVRKLRRILEANHEYYRKKGKDFPIILIKKVRNQNLWQLKIGK